MKEVKKPVAAKAAPAAKAAEVKAAPAEVKTEVKAAVKPAAPKVAAPAKKAPAKKAPAKKAPAKKAPAKKAAAPKTAAKEQFFIQFLGKDLEKDEIISRAKAAYKEAGNKAAIKSLDVYVKFEESAVYYVVNGDISGRFEI